MTDGYTDQGTPVPGYWIREVQRAKQWRREYACEDRWQDWRRWYRGQWNPAILPSNVYFKMMRTLIPRVYFRNPSVSITPKKPGWDQLLLAKLLERADNTLLDNMGIKGQMKRAVQWASMFGTSGIKLGYGAEFTPTPDALNTADPDTGGRRMRRRVEYNDLVHPNAPWALAQHPGSVVVPVGALDIHSARWVCYEMVRPLDDILDDPRFENTRELRAAMRTGNSEMGGHTASLLAPDGQTKIRDGVVLWEIRDKKTGLVFVMAPHSNAAPPSKKILFKDEDDLQIRRRLNFHPLIFNNDDEVFWGVPDSKIIEPQQMEKNEMRTQLRAHRRTLLKKLLYQTGALTPDEAHKLVADDNVDIAIQVKDINGIKVIENSQLPQGLLVGEQVVDHEVQEILGLGVNQFGEYAPGSADRSATESTIVHQASQIRVDERRDTCADLLVEVVSDMNHVIAERWDQDMILNVAGPGGVEIWVQFSPQLLKDIDYDIRVDPDTSVPLTKQLREQKAQLLLATYKDDPLVDQYKLRQFHLSEMYGVDADFILAPQPGSPGSQQQPMQLGQAAQLFQQAGQGGGGQNQGNRTPLMSVPGGKPT
jgi:hypothetical protein